jgi:hypothetical protein
MQPDPLTMTLSNELAALRDVADRLIARLETEPLPGVHCQAFALNTVARLHGELCRLLEMMDASTN